MQEYRRKSRVYKRFDGQETQSPSTVSLTERARYFRFGSGKGYQGNRDIPRRYCRADDKNASKVTEPDYHSCKPIVAAVLLLSPPPHATSKVKASVVVVMRRRFVKLRTYG